MVLFLFNLHCLMGLSMVLIVDYVKFMLSRRGLMVLVREARCIRRYFVLMFFLFRLLNRIVWYSYFIDVRNESEVLISCIMDYTLSSVCIFELVIAGYSMAVAGLFGFFNVTCVRVVHSVLIFVMSGSLKENYNRSLVSCPKLFV